MTAQWRIYMSVGTQQRVAIDSEQRAGKWSPTANWTCCCIDGPGGSAHWTTSRACIKNLASQGRRCPLTARVLAWVGVETWKWRSGEAHCKLGRDAGYLDTIQACSWHIGGAPTDGPPPSGNTLLRSTVIWMMRVNNFPAGAIGETRVEAWRIWNGVLV